MLLFPMLLLVSAQVVSTPVVAELSVKELSDRAVASRKGIHSYHIVAKSRIFTMGESETTNIAVESTYEIWSRGNKVRTDRTITKSSDQPENVDHRRINRRNCERDGYALHTNQGLKRLVGVTFYKIDNKYDMDDNCKIDWTVFSLRNHHSQGYTKGRADEVMLSMSKHKNLKIEPVTIQSQKLVTVSGDGGPGTLAQIWFAPEYSGNPVRFLMKLDVLTRETLVEYQKVDGYWYPKSTHHINKQGDKISDEEQLTFELVELNSDIPDSVFTFAGLNLLSGTPINDQPPRYCRSGQATVVERWQSRF